MPNNKQNMNDSKLSKDDFIKGIIKIIETSDEYNQTGEWLACVLLEKERTYKQRQLKSYRVRHDILGVFWLNEMDFTGQESLYQEVSEGICFYENFIISKQLKFKGPFEKYYQIVKKGNSQIILPKNKISLKKPLATGYFDKNAKRKNIKKIFNNPDPVMGEKGENNPESWLELLTSERLTTRERREIVNNIMKDLLHSKGTEHNAEKNKNVQIEKNTNLLAQDSNDKKIISIITNILDINNDRNVINKSKYLKEYLNLNNTINTQKIKSHNPKKIIEWLKLFTVNNTAIKYSTHLWDQNDLFNGYEDFVSRLNDEFVKHKFNEMPKYNSNLYWNKIYPFLFQKKLTKLQKDGKESFGWGRHKIKIGWQYPDIIAKWSKKHPGKSPLSMELPDDIKPKSPINGTTIKYFEDAVNLFKKEIEFRDNDLFIQTKVAVKEIIPNHKINEDDLETLKNSNFYTNTEYVIKAVTRILHMIKRKSASLEVNISCHFDSKNNEYVLEILHYKSFSDKPVNDPKILLKEDTGDLGIIKTTLMSLCDFSIESRLRDEKGKHQFYRIDYLYNDIEKNNWQPRITEIDRVEGFKYILKFPTI